MARTRGKNRLCRELETSTGYQAARTPPEAPEAPTSSSPPKPRAKANGGQQPSPKSGRAGRKTAAQPQAEAAPPDPLYPPRDPLVGRQFQASVPASIARPPNKRKQLAEEEMGGTLLWQPEAPNCPGPRVDVDAYLHNMANLLTREVLESALGEDTTRGLLNAMSVQEFSLVHLMLNEHDAQSALAAVPPLAKFPDVHKAVLGVVGAGWMRRRKARKPIASLQESARLALHKTALLG